MVSYGWQWLIIPIGSMVLLYNMVLHGSHQYTPNVSIYTSTMDPMGYADSSRTGTHGGQLEWSTKDRFSQHDFFCQGSNHYYTSISVTSWNFCGRLCNNIPNYMLRTLQHHGIIETVPIGSMYAAYGNIYHQYTPNVSIYIYTIHGSYGVWGSLIHPWPCCSHHIDPGHLWHVRVLLQDTGVPQVPPHAVAAAVGGAPRNRYPLVI